MGLIDLTTTTEKYESLQKLSNLDANTLVTLASIKASDLKKLGVAVEADPKIISKALGFLTAKKLFS